MLRPVALVFVDHLFMRAGPVLDMDCRMGTGKVAEQPPGFERSARFIAPFQPREPPSTRAGAACKSDSLGRDSRSAFRSPLGLIGVQLQERQFMCILRDDESNGPGTAHGRGEFPGRRDHREAIGIGRRR
jgi:hypothetical protein